MTIVEALKKLCTAFSGTSTAKTITGALKDVATAMGGTPSEGNSIAHAIDAVADAVSDLPSEPTGKINITSTAEVDVTAYASAQVVDSNLIAGNIKKDVSVLGITGEYEGSGGSSDFSTATVTLINNTDTTVWINVPVANSDDGDYYSNVSLYNDDHTQTVGEVILFHGVAFGEFPFSTEMNAVVTGDISYDDGAFEINGDGTITITASIS